MKKIQCTSLLPESQIRHLFTDIGFDFVPTTEPNPELPLLVEASSAKAVTDFALAQSVPARSLVAICPKGGGLPDGCLWLSPKILEDQRAGDLLRVWVGASETDHAQGLLAQISHDMRSPLSVISTAASLAARFGKKDAKLSRYLSLIDESSSVLKSLVNDILDFSKIREGQLAFVTSDFNLRQLAESMVESFSLLVKSPKRVTVDCQLCDDVPEFVHGDPGRLRQILTNLMSNSMKFTEIGSVSLAISKGTDSELLFRVSDTGVGIQPEALKRIFLPYQQADNHVQTSFGGTGLGLTICRLLVERMGGEIGVTSTFGEGSSFHFTAQLPTVSKEQGQALPELAGLKLLFATNNPSVLSPAVSDRNEVFVCPSEKEVGRVLRRSEFDIYIVDLALDGFELARRILLEKPEARVVVTTSAGQRGDFAHCKELGLSGYLTFPMKERELELALALVFKLDEVVTKYTAREMLAQTPAPPPVSPALVSGA